MSERAELRLIGAPDIVHAVMAVLLRTPELYVKSTGSVSSRNRPGAVQQYGRITLAPATPAYGEHVVAGPADGEQVVAGPDDGGAPPRPAPGPPAEVREASS